MYLTTITELLIMLDFLNEWVTEGVAFDPHDFTTGPPQVIGHSAVPRDLGTATKRQVSSKDA